MKSFSTPSYKRNYPREWLNGYIIPIYKKGDRTNPSNYRGITITSCLGKLFNMVLNERLSKFFEKHKIISPYQIGFKKKHRTSDHMFILNTLVNKYTGAGKKLFTCFVDMQKAFDTVNRRKLLQKLKQTGIGTLMYNLIHNMYLTSKARLSVKTGNTMTNSFNSEIGVYQGDVLSPLLFNLYVNGIVQCFNETCESPKLDSTPVNCLLYADDIVIISTSQEGLQNSMNKLNMYCKSWDLKVNTEKTKAMVFSKRKEKTYTNVTYEGKSIQTVDTYRYLGVQLNCNGKFDTTKSDLSKRGLKAIFKLKATFKNSQISFDTLMHLFDHTIKPIMVYASDVWGHSYTQDGEINFNNLLRYDDIEQTHLKYLRFALCVSKKAPNIGIYGETGRYPLAIDAMINSIKYWSRLNALDNEQLLKKAFNESKRDHQNSLCKNVEHLMLKTKINLDASTSYIANYIRKQLQDKFITFWKDKLYDDTNSKFGNKLRSYRTYKNTFKKEEYLKIKSSATRGAFSRLRLSAHKLHIETGRYVAKKDRKDPQDRLCNLCNDTLCEDEYHFVTICSYYRDHRNKLYEEICRKYDFFANYSSAEKFIWLMSNIDCNVLYPLLKYIGACFKLRNTGLCKN